MGEFQTRSARYGVDPDLRIGWTSANWDRFALENGAPELTGGVVVGRPLFDFVEGAETRAIYNAMLKRVRGFGAQIDLGFRCDSPDVRRFMMLHMTCPEDAQFTLVAELLSEESRSHVRLLDHGVPRLGDPIVICSFCKRVESRSGAWHEVEQAEIELGIVEDSPLPPLFHSVCPDCNAAAADC